MTDREILEQILVNQNMMQSEIHDLKSDVGTLKSDVKDIRLHLENVTDRNISILAENHIELVRKLHEAVKYSDRVLLNEISMNNLRERMELLEKEFLTFKKQTA